MSEENEVKAPVAKKAKKRNVKRAAAPAKKADDIFHGMTVRDCCADCNASRCVISGKPYCGHPRKGGLHPEDMSNNGALARRKEAENKLRNQLLKAD